MITRIFGNGENYHACSRSTRVVHVVNGTSTGKDLREGHNDGSNALQVVECIPAPHVIEQTVRGWVVGLGCMCMSKASGARAPNTCTQDNARVFAIRHCSKHSNDKHGGANEGRVGNRDREVVGARLTRLELRTMSPTQSVNDSTKLDCELAPYHRAEATAPTTQTWVLHWDHTTHLHDVAWRTPSTQQPRVADGTV